MASTTWVIRLVQADKNRTPILIKVSPKEGGHDLDLDLFATDGEAAYLGKVRQRSLKKLRAKNYDGSDDDWANIVSSVLKTKIDSSIESQQKENLDVTCSISGKDPVGTLSIALNNKVEDITQRLGTIELSQTDDTDDVDLFGWASQAIEKRDVLQRDVTSSREQAKAKDEIVASLQKQIDELVEAKAEHEKQMLSKFALLLNEKKLKIRNMQRILSTAKTDQKKLKELQAVIGNEPASVARKNKRPADDEIEDEDADQSDDFETMNTNPVTNVEPESPSSRNSTPTASEADDDTDEEDLSGPAAYSNKPRTRAVESQVKQKESQKQSEEQAQKKPEPAPTPNDDETASEDEEEEL